jgi:CRISPR/Cas system-associated protein Cas5 (RAMP superfamily)
LYFRNKNTYFPGKDARVLLSGIAYVLSKTRAVPDNKAGGRESADSDLAFHYENGDRDDYVFRGSVKDVREYEVLGKKARVLKVAFRTGADSVIDLYVCATENAIREKIRKGDHVSGIIWLQGFVL